MRRGVVAVATIVALVGGSVTASAVVPALLSMGRLPDPVPLLGALESTASPGRAGSIPQLGEFPPIEQSIVDELRARPAPVVDLAVLQEAPVERDAFTDTFDAGNGLMATSVAGVQRNMQVDGEWVPIADALSKGEDGFAASPHPLAPVFAPTSAGEVFAVVVDGYRISWSLLEAKEVPGELAEDGTSVTYRGVAPGVDLRYSLDGPGVKEEFVLAELPGDEASVPAFRFAVSSPGLVLSEADDGSLRFVDAEGVERAIVPPPLMWDSSGVAEVSESELARVELTVERHAGGTAGELVGAAPLAELGREDGASGVAVVAVAPDARWLLDPERVYPVVVDPSQWSAGYSAANSWKSDGVPYWGSLHVGRPTAGVFWRGFAQWNLAPIAGQLVYDTTVVIGYGGSGTTNCYAGWVGDVLSSPPSDFSHYNDDLADYALCDDTAYASNGILDALDSTVASYVRSGILTPWLAVRGQKGSAYSYKRVEMALVVWWYAPPSLTGVAGATPVGGAVGPRVPTMEGTGTDPLGQGLQFRYEFEQAGPGEDGLGPFTSIVYDSGWVPAGPFTLPSSALQPGTPYRYKVSMRDKADGHLGNDTTKSTTDASWYFVTNEPPVVESVGAVPQVTASLHPTVVTESGPMFSVPYAERPGHPATTVKYRFTVATGPEGKSGLVADSGWLTPTSTTIGDPVTWDAPEGTLRDGVAYTWTVTTDDGVDTASSPLWVGRVKLERRLGPAGPSPYDSAGPAAVNLASGNLALAFPSQQVSTLGGDIGMVFSYNSQTDLTAIQGLTGQYFTALDPSETSTTTFDFTGRTPLLTRTDGHLNMSWGDESPAPPVPKDYFMVRWVGA